MFRRFLDDHYGRRLSRATQVGAFKGHPIVYTTWVGHCVAPGALYLGEAARVTHNATGEGISHAMQSGIYAADAVADVLAGRTSEEEAWKAYVWKHRKRFTLGRYLQLGTQPHHKLLLSLLNSFGIADTTIGDAKYGTGPLTGLS